MDTDYHLHTCQVQIFDFLNEFELLTNFSNQNNSHDCFLEFRLVNGKFNILYPYNSDDALPYGSRKKSLANLSDCVQDPVRLL